MGACRGVIFWQWRWTTGFPLNSSRGLPSPQDRCSLSHNCNTTAVFRLVQRPSRTLPVHSTHQKLSPFPSGTAKSAFHLTRTDRLPSPRGGHRGHRARRTSQLPRATRAARPREEGAVLARWPSQGRSGWRDL